MSVLHHIPDYLTSLRQAAKLVRPGGAIVTFQVPLYCPRLRRTTRAAARSAETAWRLTQGHIGRGLQTQARGLRGLYDKAEPSDTFEYYCVRNGVDEQAVADLVAQHFHEVEVHRSWSTKRGALSSWGRSSRTKYTFGVIA